MVYHTTRKLLFSYLADYSVRVINRRLGMHSWCATVSLVGYRVIFKPR